MFILHNSSSDSCFNIFSILQINFVPICLKVESFNSQQGAEMDVHESQFVLETTST
jgi:hypothetical protein